ncbi:MAG TPA: hypothetical protein DEQ02_09700 [Ruminococcaceae bacterium]|nr:hypothetical protein [Oscillospiraceae bacterium]
MFIDCKFNMKDVIATLLVLGFCFAIFMPSNVVSYETMQLFERILGTVIGFYFGAHVAQNNQNKR